MDLKNLPDLKSRLKKNANFFKAQNDLFEKDDKQAVYSLRVIPNSSFLNLTALMEETKKDRIEIEVQKNKFWRLRDELEASYKDLLALRKDRSEFYENLTKQNNEIVLRVLSGIHKTEDEISLMEDEMSCTEQLETLEGLFEDDSSILSELPFHPAKEPEPRKIPKTEIKKSLDSLKLKMSQLKDQLFNFYNYVSAIHFEYQHEHLIERDIQSAILESENEKLKKYINLLKEISTKAHSEMVQTV